MFSEIENIIHCSIFKTNCWLIWWTRTMKHRLFNFCCKNVLKLWVYIQAETNYYQLLPIFRRDNVADLQSEWEANKLRLFFLCNFILAITLYVFPRSWVRSKCTQYVFKQGPEASWHLRLTASLKILLGVAIVVVLNLTMGGIARVFHHY